MKTASCTLNMESSCSSESSVNNYQTRRHHILLESILACHFHASRKSHSTNNCFFHEDGVLRLTRNVGKLPDYTSYPRRHNGGFIIVPNDGSSGVFLTFVFLTKNGAYVQHAHCTRYEEFSWGISWKTTIWRTRRKWEDDIRIDHR
jgi:hypothetical protein